MEIVRDVGFYHGRPARFRGVCCVKIVLLSMLFDLIKAFAPHFDITVFTPVYIGSDESDRRRQNVYPGKHPVEGSIDLGGLARDRNMRTIFKPCVALR